MKDRLAQFLKNEGLTAVKFAEIMEVQPSSISHLLSGRNKPNFDFISRMLLRFPELNPDWVINGRGGIYRSKPNESPELFTRVNNPAVTNVNTERHSQESIEIMDESNDFSVAFEQNMPFYHADKNITNVNQNHLVSSENSPNTSVENHSKTIRRVIIFFTDGSFEEYS